METAVIVCVGAAVFVLVLAFFAFALCMVALPIFGLSWFVAKLNRLLRAFCAVKPVAEPFHVSDDRFKPS